MAEILRIIITPTLQQKHVLQKSGLNVERLEEVTMESMANWFNDKGHPENAEAKLIVEEIFKVARAEERYRYGELGMKTLAEDLPAS